MASDTTYIQTVNDPADIPQRTQIRRTQFVDTDGNPIAGPTGGGDAPVLPPAGSLTPAMLNGYDAGTGHGRIPQVKADGTGFDLIDPATLKGQKGDPGTAGAPGAKGADGKSVNAIALTADATGKTTAAITVTTASKPAGDQPADQPSAIQ